MHYFPDVRAVSATQHDTHHDWQVTQSLMVAGRTQDGCGRERRRLCVATRRSFEFGALRSSCGTTKCQLPTHSFQLQVSSFPRFCAALPCVCLHVACRPTSAASRASEFLCTPLVPSAIVGDFSF